jgi:hypothetical protein
MAAVISGNSVSRVIWFLFGLRKVGGTLKQNNHNPDHCVTLHGDYCDNTRIQIPSLASHIDFAEICATLPVLSGSVLLMHLCYAMKCGVEHDMGC